MKVPADLVPGENPPPGLQKATFSLRLHRESALVSSSSDEGTA